MVRRLGAAALLVAVALLSACSPGTEEVAEPEEVETCEGLVDVGSQLVRAFVQVVEELRVDTLLDDGMPPEFVELQRLGRDLDTRAAGLGCDLAALNAEIADAVADLETTGPVAEMLLDIVASGLINAETTPPEDPATGDTDPSDEVEDLTDLTDELTDLGDELGDGLTDSGDETTTTQG